MRRPPAANDFDGWVSQLGVSTCRQRAKVHLLTSGPRAVPAVRRGLQHPKAIVRRLCVRILDRLVDEASLPHLVLALDDDDPEVRAAALHALACDQCKQDACRPGDDLWLPRALEYLQSDPNPDIRAAAIDALGKAATRRADVAAALFRAAETDSDPRLRTMARRRADRSVSAP